MSRRIDEYDEEESDPRDLDSVGTDEGFAILELGQVPPSVPIRWIEIQGESRDLPYANPGEEFIRSPYPISLKVLARRWQGIVNALDIEQKSIQENWKEKRFLYQDKVMDEALAGSLADDAQLQRRILNRDIVNFSGILERLQGDFAAEVEIRPVRGAGPFGYVEMPMTIESKSKLANAAVAVSNLLNTRVGLATQIIEKNSKVTFDVSAELKQKLLEDDPEYAELMAVANMGKKSFASQRGELLAAGQGEIYEAQLVEAPNERSG